MPTLNITQHHSTPRPRFAEAIENHHLTVAMWGLFQDELLAEKHAEEKKWRNKELRRHVYRCLIIENWYGAGVLLNQLLPSPSVSDYALLVVKGRAFIFVFFFVSLYTRIGAYTHPLSFLSCRSFLFLSFVQPKYTTKLVISISPSTQWTKRLA